MHNDIVKPYRLGIIQYTERALVIHYLYKCLTSPLQKGDEYDMAYWTIFLKKKSKNKILVVTNGGIPVFINDEV